MRKDHPFLHPGCQEDVACSYPALPPVASPPSRYSRIVIGPPPPPPPPVSDHNLVFSKSVMAMVAVISTVLLVVSLFITSVRCYQRRNPIRRAMQRRQTPPPAMDQFLEVEEPINPSWYINTVGLDASLINSITSSKFKSGEGLVEETGCSVCLSEFEDGDDLRLLPKCGHAFHLQCIDRWLGAHANCPLCRTPIFANNLNSVSGENIATGTPSMDASYALELADDRESNGDRSRNSDSLAAEIGESRRENETVIANLNVLRVLGAQSSGAEQNGMTVAETTAFQPVRRSVSLSSFARIHARVDLPCGSMGEAGSSDCENVNLGVFSRFREVGTEPCPSGLRRSSSIGTNFFFSKHGRNRRLVLPL